MQLTEGAARTELHPSYAAIGNLHEELHAKENPQAKREVPFKTQFGEWTVSGRADFVFEDSIDECKATFTRPTITKAKCGEVELSHLAQLTCYLSEFGLSRGRIVYGYFVIGKDGEFKRLDCIPVEVEIDANHDVLVAGVKSGYSTKEIANTILRISHWRESDQPAPRPAGVGFNSPCKYCPLATLCDRIEQENLQISEVKQEAIGLAESASSPTPKPSKER